MRVKEAKELARQWIIEEGHHISGFYGAFYTGSINWLSDETILPLTSDVDVLVVLTDPAPPDKPGKFIYRDVLLEVSYLSRDQLQSAEQILGDYRIAGNFRAPNIIMDPSGDLTRLQMAVARDYAIRQWVFRRCEDARGKLLENLQSLDESAPFHDQVMTWLFGTGKTTHVLLAAGLKNPTVRKRYLAVRELLVEYSLLDFYPTLLELLGCARISRERVEYHLAALSEVFDLTKTVVKTPFFFNSDLSDSARPIAIAGSRELIEGGFHREAVFWLVATYSRCQKVLFHDAPVPIQERFHPGYRQLISDLGITSSADLRQRCEQVKEFLPRLWEVTEVILNANPEIED